MPKFPIYSISLLLIGTLTILHPSNHPIFSWLELRGVTPKSVLANQGTIKELKTAPNKNLSQIQSQSSADILQELSNAQVIYLGETHDNSADHAAKLEIIQQMAKTKKIAIAMEMFQRPYQNILDAYIQGNISETELIEQTEYQTRWGFPWEFYAPILRFARENQIPVLALNVPSEITRQVARQGLESLTEEQKKFIPPFSEIRTDNSEYRQLIREVYDTIHQNHGSSENFEKFFLAQVLWDETMAEVIANFHQTNPDYQIIVLAGKGHIVYGYGIPSRVLRRVTAANTAAKNSNHFRQLSVLLSPIPELEWDTNKPIADFIWPTSAARTGAE